MAFNQAVYYNIFKAAALILLLFAVSIYIPFPGFFCSFFIPLPILYYRVKLGRQITGILSAVVIIAIALIAEIFSFNTLYVMSLVLLGFMLGDLLASDYSIELSVLISSAAVMLLVFLSIFVYSSSLNKGIIEFITDYITRNMEMTVKLYEKIDANPEILHKISSLADKLGAILIRILPGLIASSALIVSWAAVLSSKKLFDRNNININAMLPSLKKWKAPDYLIWAVIACAALFFLKSEALKILGLNGLIVLLTIYFFQGMAIISFYFEKKNVPPFFRIFLYCLIFLQHFLLFIVIGIGLFDIWINFRKIKIGENK